MSKQSEAKIGVGTSLTVCYSKNDSPINLRGGKYVVLDVVVVMSTVRTFTDASTPSDSLVSVLTFVINLEKQDSPYAADGRDHASGHPFALAQSRTAV